MLEIEALFLHWGPGGHTSVEREWFDAALGVDWWDQPRGVGFDGLVMAALERVRSKRAPKLRLVAHSFGAQLALEILSRFPERVEDVLLLGSAAWTPLAFIHLGERLGLRDQALATRQSFSSATFWGLIQAISGVPGFLDTYWGPNSKEAKHKYESLLGNRERMDLGAFQAVMGEYIEKPRRERPIPFSGRVQIWLGGADPLIELEEDREAWRRLLPQAEIESLAGLGHFLQFETCPRLLAHLGRS